MKWRFAVKFLVAFAALLVLWSLTGFAELYRIAVLATVQLLSPLVNGWWLEYDRPGLSSPVVFRMGDHELAMLLQLPALSFGLVQLLSLLAATPGMNLRRAARNLALAPLLFFLVDVIVVLVYPLVMGQPNALKDTLGVYSGLLAFVVAPLALWFTLTYSTLRSVWGFTPDDPRPTGRTG